MARRLSNIEWATFLSVVDVPNIQDLPPWGGVVWWNEQAILVYIAPSGEIYATDVTDDPQLIKNVPRYYDANQEIWYYRLSEQLVIGTIQFAQDAGKVLKDVAVVAGETSGAILSPTLQALSIPLAAVGIVLVLMYLPKSKSR